MENKLILEYKKQADWRNWESYIEQLLINSTDTILDLGCGTGDVTTLLAKRASNVIGIDHNQEFIEFAEHDNKHKNKRYIRKDLKSIEELNLPLVDGIWSSFVAAYFPNFQPILNKWLKLLKLNGWIALVEINDLFSHKLIEEDIEANFKKFYNEQRKNNIYDCEMGKKLKQCFLNKGIEIIFEKNMEDKELVFTGIADGEIVEAWRKRFDRSLFLQKVFGKEYFNYVKDEFLKLLNKKEHYCESKIYFVKGKNRI